MLKIPLIMVKDKQAFTSDGLRLLGKPVEVAKRFREDGCRLIHIVDRDALRGSSSNLDVYDKLTYVMNAQVECAPALDLVQRLLSLRCRVVLRPPVPFDPKTLSERRLLVAMVRKDHQGDLSGFHDVVLEDADEGSVEAFAGAGLRVIVVGKAPGKSKPFGCILPVTSS